MFSQNAQLDCLRLNVDPYLLVWNIDLSVLYLQCCETFFRIDAVKLPTCYDIGAPML